MLYYLKPSYVCVPFFAPDTGRRTIINIARGSRTYLKTTHFVWFGETHNSTLFNTQYARRKTMTTTTTRSSATAATATVVAVSSLAVVVITSAFTHWYQERKLRQLEKQWDDKRLAERTGRIRAEIQLRSALKQLKDHRENENGDDGDKTRNNNMNSNNNNNPKNKNNNSSSSNNMSLKCIGTIVSPFTKRMGTPRQGALAPSSRGFVQLQNIPTETLHGMEDYSHGWIVFQFHANTDLASSQKTKIRPPRAPKGTKVGQLATRSPHRPNPLGLSLVKIDYLDAPRKRLYISALDLVNGTPVYDIKPYVPWDIPGYYEVLNDNNKNTTRNTEQPQQQQHQSQEQSSISPPPNNNSTTTTTTIIATPHKNNVCQVPDWVDQDDTLSNVVFTPQARTSLETMVQHNHLAPLYTTQNNGYQGAYETIQQVLSQDPRASNRRGTTSSSQQKSTYKLILCKIQIEFQMLPNEDSTNNTDEPMIVQVVSINRVEFDKESFVDGIPLVKSAPSSTDRSGRNKNR